MVEPKKLKRDLPLLGFFGGDGGGCLALTFTPAIYTRWDFQRNICMFLSGNFLNVTSSWDGNPRKGHSFSVCLNRPSPNCDMPPKNQTVQSHDHSALQKDLAALIRTGIWPHGWVTV